LYAAIQWPFVILLLIQFKSIGPTAAQMMMCFALETGNFSKMFGMIYKSLNNVMKFKIKILYSYWLFDVKNSCNWTNGYKWSKTLILSITLGLFIFSQIM
jgi:hypothetical protein